MAKETAFEHPPKGHVAVLGYEKVGDDHVTILVDGDGRLIITAGTATSPSGAATEDTLLDCKEALEKVDDLRTALSSVGTDELDVNIDDWPGTPVVYNVTMTTASTEYNQALPANTRKFMIKCRGAYDIKVCFVAEGSGTLYVTVPSGQSYWEDQINDTAITLYFQCATAAQVAEIVAWN